MLLGGFQKIVVSQAVSDERQNDFIGKVQVTLLGCQCFYIGRSLAEFAAI
jgi:hypothetical protein